MKFLKKIFGSKDKKNQDSSVVQIEEQIEICKQNIIRYEQDIYQFNKAINEIIHKIFFVPKKYWYSELKNLQNIIELPENQKISDDIKKEALELIQTYKKHIQIRLNKIQFCKTSIKKLIELKEKIENLQRKIHQEQQKIEVLRKHKQKLMEIQDNDFQYDIFSKIQLMKNELADLTQKLEFYKELNKQLAQLYFKYYKSSDTVQVNNFEKELEKLIKKTENE